MKKSALLIAGLLAWGSTSMHADEGMWTLYNLPDAVYEQMVAEGFQLPCDMLYNSPDAISNYVVNFSGFCSGVVVSPDGLVFTNHHCGFSAINAHSTVEHDYMKDGFYARNYVEELPNENMFVSFMKNQQDITDRVNRLIAGKNAEQTEAAIDSLTNHMTDSVKAIDKTLHVTIDPFYEGNKYYATTYQDFPDVRLVFTVPKSMGKFGGETDNWMWPRQTCDFSVFRIYADPKTNGPAAYSKDNVPYHPAHWAPVSLEGYKDKDFAMTVGYPGSTSRYLSSYGIQQRRDVDNTTRVQVRDIKLADETGCPFHACHISSKESVELIRDAKKSGVDVSCETAPHYLIMNDMDLKEDGWYKMNPPIRAREDQEALIEGILDGTVDMIATDHSPHAAEEKDREYIYAPSGWIIVKRRRI